MKTLSTLLFVLLMGTAHAAQPAIGSADSLPAREGNSDSIRNETQRERDMRMRREGFEDARIQNNNNMMRNNTNTIKSPCAKLSGARYDTCMRDNKLRKY